MRNRDYVVLTSIVLVIIFLGGLLEGQSLVRAAFLACALAVAFTLVVRAITSLKRRSSNVDS